MAAIDKILPNIGCPRSSKREVLCGALHNIILYGAPVWVDVFNHKKYVNLLTSTQRNMLIRVASSYRTASAEALQVVAGVVPIDLMIRESVCLFEFKEDGKSGRKEAREMILVSWQERSNNCQGKAQWTRRLIKDIKSWVQCQHREVEYYLTGPYSPWVF